MVAMSQSREKSTGGEDIKDWRNQVVVKPQSKKEISRDVVQYRTVASYICYIASCIWYILGYSGVRKKQNYHNNYKIGPAAVLK
jgi:hypothetical protein